MAEVVEEPEAIEVKEEPKEEPKKNKIVVSDPEVSGSLEFDEIEL
jgi:predicted RNA-binding protein YlqC (UPF0109 family)